MSMEPCALAKTCLMDRRCVDYHQCVVEQVTESTVRAHERAKTVEQFTAALLTGLDELPRHNGDGTCIGAGDVADLVHKVALEVGRT